MAVAGFRLDDGGFIAFSHVGAYTVNASGSTDDGGTWEPLEVSVFINGARVMIDSNHNHNHNRPSQASRFVSAYEQWANSSHDFAALETAAISLMTEAEKVKHK